MGSQKSDLNEISSYYDKKISEYGATPRGVDWNSAEGQSLRFLQLQRVFPEKSKFSLFDLGCGYGAFYNHLIKEGFYNFLYEGVDVSKNMIDAATSVKKECKDLFFTLGDRPKRICDYGIASGIFNVRIGLDERGWHDHVEITLDLINRNSKLGFAFNLLTTYSDVEKRKDYLFYADPCYFFDLCKRRYSRDVALLHDYGLYEFTVIVRK